MDNRIKDAIDLVKCASEIKEFYRIMNEKYGNEVSCKAVLTLTAAFLGDHASDHIKGYFEGLNQQAKNYSDSFAKEISPYEEGL